MSPRLRLLRSLHCLTSLGLLAMLTASLGCSSATDSLEPLESQASAAEAPTADADADSPDAATRDKDEESSKGQAADKSDAVAAERDQAADGAEQRDESAEAERAEGEQDLPSADDPANPFPRRINVPDFPKDMSWLNTSGPLRKQDLKGKFVLLDFWTYCCINCIHILPELKKLEEKYPDELVVIGVHSAKFETEKDSKNIEEAILRYEIKHPVVNDAEHQIWNMFGVRSWPTLLMIDPEGYAVWGRSGEFKFEEVDAVLQAAMPYYRQQKLLDETPIHFDLLEHRQQKTPLRFPGKVLADEAGNRLFISDSNNNRIVISTLDGQLLDTIGSGAIGRKDGGYQAATFDHPQGMALDGDTLYVADTENHLLRAVDLASKQVRTIAGTGEQARNAWPGLLDRQPGDPLPKRYVGKPSVTALNSPWDLLVHGSDLYIAMAGPHQIWKMTLDATEIGPYAGNGREDIVDGPLLPPKPYEQGYSSFAQPSGLSTDGTWLFVADSEGSSIRAVPFDPEQEVRTVVGTAELPYGRLFRFGDQDGAREQVLLQHALGVVYHDGNLYITDTYNNKVKVIDAASGHTQTLAGTGEPGADDAAGTFDEPSGISFAAGKLFVADTNNHKIRVVDPASGSVATLEIEGLEPPSTPQDEQSKQPEFKGAVRHQLPKATLQAKDGQVTLDVKLALPEGWKINPLAPMAYYVMGEQPGSVKAEAIGRHSVEQPTASFSIALPVAGEGQGEVQIGMNYYYCQEGGEGLCKVGSVVWTVPLEVSPSGSSEPVTLEHEVK